MLGCTPKGRHTEQHDVYFTVAPTIRDTVPGIIQFWPEAEGRIHIDAWREVNRVDDFQVEVVLKRDPLAYPEAGEKLFFINLGGYKEGEFEEFHYKLLVAAADKSAAIQQAKQTAFYKHTRFKGAESHIDDKFGVDVDDIYEIADILPAGLKENYRIKLTPRSTGGADKLHLGYFKLANL